LDVGGAATAERVTEAFKIILSDEKVKGILVNIFGGIVRCDLIAKGIIIAIKEVNINVPVVVRLEGNHAFEGTALLDQSGLDLISATDLKDAAIKIVAAVGDSL
jgi:succinyl-CoA synthetase beta subunit